MKFFIRLCIVMFYLLGASNVNAQLRIPGYFTDNMILQRDKPIKFWGWDKPNTAVEVNINGTSYKGTANADSIWSVWLNPKSAGGVYQFKIKGSDKTITIKNATYGDVWFCSGQSNMEFSMKNIQNHAQEVTDSYYPFIRQFSVKHATAISPLNDVNSSDWTVCNKTSIDHFSAVAFIFAKELYNKYKVPIGIINASWGGSNISTFMSVDDLRNFPLYEKKVAEITPTFIQATKERNKQILDSAKPASGTTKVQAAKGVVNIENGYPSMVYNGMINPFFNYSVKGVVWQQGEANRGIPGCFDYQKLLTSMINRWRSGWNNKNLPFLVVQLSNYGEPNTQPNPSGWAVVQDEQAKASYALSNTGLVVTNDLGLEKNMHYPNKQVVGKRLFLLAQKMVYGESNIVGESPRFKSFIKVKNQLIISFDNIGDGLVAVNNNKGGLSNFAVAGVDNKFYRAEATISGDKVIVSCSDVSSPVNVRYAFESNPQGLNFYNKNGLPVIPFRTDSLRNFTKPF